MFDLSPFIQNNPENESFVKDVYLNPRNDFYVIGDLYHIFRKWNPDFWYKICTETNNFENNIWSDYNREIFIYNFPTIHGQGLYQDKKGNAFLIDSGTIGCMSSFSFSHLMRDSFYLTNKFKKEMKKYSPFLYISEYDFVTLYFPIEYKPDNDEYTHRFGDYYLNMRTK